MSKKNKCEATDRETTTSAYSWNPPIRSLIPEGRTLVKVSPNAKLEEATTLMRAYNYSQLPVMEGEKKVNGVISWKSIGSSKIAQTGTSKVRHFMDNKISRQIVNDTDSILGVVDIIAEHDYVLVINQQQVIFGIVTASDISIKFRDLYEPFHFSGTIESDLRHIIKNANFTASDIKKASRKLGSRSVEDYINKLTLSQCNQLICPEENWRKLNLEDVDRDTFRDILSKVAEIRNPYVHHRAFNLTDEDMSLLRSFSDFLKDLVNDQVEQNSP